MLKMPNYILQAIREGTIAGVMQMIVQLVLYMAGYEYYASPLPLLAVFLSYALITFRMYGAWKLGKVKRLLANNFGFIFIAFAFGSFINLWFRFFMLKTLDPNLNQYIIGNAVAMAEEYYKTIKLPAEKLPAEINGVVQDADLTLIPTLLNSYLSELLISLFISGILAYFLKSEKDRLEAEDAAIEEEINKQFPDNPDSEGGKPPIFTPILK
jgi:hypothetical protein